MKPWYVYLCSCVATIWGGWLFHKLYFNYGVEKPIFFFKHLHQFYVIIWIQKSFRKFDNKAITKSKTAKRIGNPVFSKASYFGKSTPHGRMGESNIVIFSPKGRDQPLAASVARWQKLFQLLQTLTGHCAKARFSFEV